MNTSLNSPHSLVVRVGENCANKQVALWRRPVAAKSWIWLSFPYLMYPNNDFDGVRFLKCAQVIRLLESPPSRASFVVGHYFGWEIQFSNGKTTKRPAKHVYFFIFRWMQQRALSIYYIIIIIPLRLCKNLSFDRYIEVLLKQIEKTRRIWSWTRHFNMTTAINPATQRQWITFRVRRYVCLFWREIRENIVTWIHSPKLVSAESCVCWVVTK